MPFIVCGKGILFVIFGVRPFITSHFIWICSVYRIEFRILLTRFNSRCIAFIAVDIFSVLAIQFLTINQQINQIFVDIYGKIPPSVLFNSTNKSIFLLFFGWPTRMICWTKKNEDSSTNCKTYQQFNNHFLELSFLREHFPICLCVAWFNCICRDACLHVCL